MLWHLDTRSAGAAAAPAASAAAQSSQVCAILFPRSHAARYAVKVAVFIVVVAISLIMVVACFLLQLVQINTTLTELRSLSSTPILSSGILPLDLRPLHPERALLAQHQGGGKVHWPDSIRKQRQRGSSIIKSVFHIEQEPCQLHSQDFVLLLALPSSIFAFRWARCCRSDSGCYFFCVVDVAMVDCVWLTNQCSR